MSNIDDRLDRIERKLDEVLSLLRGGAGANTSANSKRSNGNFGGEAATPPQNGGLEVASDADLDGPRGNPEVRFMPKRWTGTDYRGKKYSECDAEFLEKLAEAFEWFAQRDDESNAVDKNGNPKSRWSRLDAARARGWAARLRGVPGVSGSPRSNNTQRTSGNTSTARRTEAAAPPKMDPYAPADGPDDDIPF